MKVNKKWLLWIGLSVTVILGALWQFYPLPDAKGRLDAMPLSGSSFEGRDTPLNDFEKNAFAGVNLIKRVYQAGTQQCFVTVLDGTRNRHIVHDPFYCFRGGGWQLINKEKLPLKNGYASVLKMRKGMHRREALVWFSDGKEQHASAFLYFIQTTLRRLTLGASGSEPVLIVIQPMNTASLNWETLIAEIPALQQL